MMPDLKYYLAVFARRLHYFILIFAAVTAVALTLAYKLPAAYESTAQLLLQAPQIPDQLAAPTVNTSGLEELQVYQQRLMTRQNLLDIARKFNVFPKIGTMTPDDIVAGMTADTTIVNASQRGQATTMSITFKARTAQIAAAVANEYVTRLLSDSATSRTTQAQATQQFFRQDVDRLAADLSTQSAKILEFQKKNADALPDSLAYRQKLQSDLQDKITKIDNDVSNLRNQKQQLIEMYQSTGQMPGQRAIDQTPEAKQLSTLRGELAGALAVLSPTNPKVTMLQAQISQLEATVRTQISAKDTATTSQPKSMLDIHTGALDTSISQLQQQRASAVKQLAAVSDSISRTAANGVLLAGLQRDYDTIDGQYKAANNRLSLATTGEQIEAQSKGQRLTLIDPPAVPDAPSKPNRVKIALYGVIGGLAMGFGLIILVEMLNTSVQRPVDLTRALNITPIGTIPFVRTPAERRRRRLMFGVLSLIVLLGLPAGIWAVSTYYMPLDLVIAKISNKMGL